MTTPPPDDKATIDERLRRLGLAKDLQRAMAAGIGKLPVSDTTKSSLTEKSATAVVVVGETGVALAKGAVSAAKDGAETFQRTRQEYQEHTADTAPAAAPEPATAEPTDVTARLERLSELHRTGQLDDEEYRVAKAKVIAGE